MADENDFKLSPEEMARVEGESREQVKMMGQPIDPKRPGEQDAETEEAEE